MLVCVNSVDAVFSWALVSFGEKNQCTFARFRRTCLSHPKLVSFNFHMCFQILFSTICNPRFFSVQCTVWSILITHFPNSVICVLPFVYRAQSCPTLCDPVDCSPPGSSVHRIPQTRILEWVAISVSRESSRTRDWTCVSCIGRWILYHWATSEAHINI